MQDDAIRTTGLTKRYGKTQALRGIDLTVRRGQIVGLIGPNGSGKSTTLKILLNLVFPTTGSATVLGFDVVRDSLEVRRRTGFVPDESRLYRSARGRFLLRFADRLHHGRVDAARREALARTLDVPLDRRVKTYSTGMKQKLALVIALSHRPDLLVLDEPTNGLDPSSRAQVLDLLRAEHARGITILLSSHVLSELERMCDTIVFLRRGELVTDGEVAALRDRFARFVRVSFASEVPDAALVERGAKSVVRRKRDLLVEVDGDPRRFIARAAELPITSIEHKSGDLEDVYRELYLRDETQSA
ncbi:MAG: ABC transporter ATP-binding protein [Planctomycetes bacterium]|nr:ABC transporter ATP-binding protein [Planctomycetota bacterium]MBI3843316.1 ABC transporter ATP-binding protein [Planctomycetota bacterium]